MVGALAVFFKTQIFAAAFPLLLCYAILAWPMRKSWKWLVLGGCIAAGIAFLPVVNRFYVGPNIRFDFSGSDWYWHLLANWPGGRPPRDRTEFFKMFIRFLPTCCRRSGYS